MPIFNLVPRPIYHKNGTQWIGKVVNAIIGESRYEWVRLEKRIMYARFWYTKQNILFRLNQQFPYFAYWFSLLNKQDTSAGFPSKRQYERYQDFAVFNVNSEGWFQFYFFVAAILVALWNYSIVAGKYDIKGVTPEDDDLYRYKDAYTTTNFDRTKYNFDKYFMATHYFAYMRRNKSWRDHPDDPRMNWRVQLGRAPYGLDRYYKYYGYSENMRLV